MKKRNDLPLPWTKKQTSRWASAAGRGKKWLSISVQSGDEKGKERKKRRKRTLVTSTNGRGKFFPN